MINRKTRRTGILPGGILAAILFAVDTKKTQSVEKHIIKPYETQCIRTSDEPEHVTEELNSEAETKQLRDILNRAAYDEDMNDGRNIKMMTEEYTIKIIYRDDSRVCIQLWDSLVRVDQIWYRLDRRDREWLEEIW